MEHSFERKIRDVPFEKTELNKLVMDYLVTGGYPHAAEKFSREANVQAHTSWDAIVERVEIRDAIHKGDLQLAIEKINELNPEILDSDRPLHFKLRRLQLIEMIRTYLANPTKENTERALEFANQDLAPFAPTAPEFLTGLQEAMGLFILAPSSSNASEIKGPLVQLLEPGQRRKVAEEVNQAILASQGSRREARLYQLVKTRQWAEKQAREKKIDLPARLDMGLDGDQPAENGSNGHANANGHGEDSVMGETHEGEADAGDDRRA